MRRIPIVLFAVAGVAAIVTPTATAAPVNEPAAPAPPAEDSAPQAEEPIEQLMRIRLDKSEDIQTLIELGVDFTHDIGQGPGATIDATVILPEGTAEALEVVGAEVIDSAN